MAVLPNDPSGYSIDTIFTIAQNILNFLTGAGATAAVIAFIWGAIQYFLGATGGDKEGKAAKGKTIIYWAVVGIIVMLLARVIVAQVFAVLQPANTPDLNNPGSTVDTATTDQTITPSTTTNSTTPTTSTPTASTFTISAASIVNGKFAKASACPALGGTNTAPTIRLTNIPAGTKSLSLDMVDQTNGDIHWTVTDIPATTSVIDGSTLAVQPYAGVCPTSGTHTYQISVTAGSVTKTIIGTYTK